MSLPDNDSDEEWARIADAVNVFEAKYIAARNAIPTPPPIAESPSSAPAPTSHPVPSFPQPQPDAPIVHPHAFANPPSMAFAPPAPHITSLLPRPPSIQPAQPQPPQPLQPPVVQPNAIPDLRPSTLPPASTTVQVPPSSSTAALSAAGFTHASLPDTDPYSLALARKDAELRALHEERKGELGNYRNKIRALQNELHVARRTTIPVPPTTSTASATVTPVTSTVLHVLKGAASTIGLPHPSAHKLAELADDNRRLHAELDQAQTDARAKAESFMFAQQELTTLRDRERKHVAVLRSHAVAARRGLLGSDDGDSLMAGDSMRDIRSSLPPVVPALTQPGEVVEGTQMPVEDVGGTSQSQAIAIPNGAEAGRFSASAARPPSRRRRRVSTARSCNGTGRDGGAGLGGGGSPVAIARKRGRAGARGVGNAGSSNKASGVRVSEKDVESKTVTLLREGVEEAQHGWGVDFETDAWAGRALRLELFSGRLGQQLMALSRRLRPAELSDALAGGVACDGGWERVLEALMPIVPLGRGPGVTALQATLLVLTYMAGCRRRAALDVLRAYQVAEGVACADAGMSGGIVRVCVDALEIATRKEDALVAGLCMDVLQTVVMGSWCDEGKKGVVDKGDSEKAAVEAVCKMVLTSEAVLFWVRGARRATREGGQDVYDGGESCVTRALQLMECVSGVAVEAQHDNAGDVRWDMVETMYEVAGEVLSQGADEGDWVEIALGMMTRAAIHAPYLVSDFGGGDGLCAVLCRAVRWLQRDEELNLAALGHGMAVLDFGDNCGGDGAQHDWIDVGMERTRVVGILRAVVGCMVLAAGGMGGKLEVSVAGRQVAMGAVALLGWPRGGWAATPREFNGDGRFRDECRKAWGVLSTGGDVVSVVSASAVK